MDERSRTPASEAAGGQARRRRVRQPIHSQLVVRLRDLIVEGGFAEGSHLSERLLCDRLAVSRAPVREALKVLSAEGLVELLPNQGARISSLTVEHVRDIFEVVAVLEKEAARLVCRKASGAAIAMICELHFRMERHLELGNYSAFFNLNLEIHQAIADCSGNEALATTYRNLNARIRRYRFFTHQELDSENTSLKLLESSFRTALAEHEAMITALRAREGERLAELIEKHYQLELVLARLEGWKQARTPDMQEPDAAPQ